MSFSTVKVYGEKATANKVYYNATVVNNTTRTDQKDDDPSIVYADTRQNPVILDVSKYNLSVENFTVNGATKNLPVFIPQIAPVAQIPVTDYESDGTTTTYYISSFPPIVLAGDYVTSVRNIVNNAYNFSTPQLVTAVDGVSFTVAYVTPAVAKTVTHGTAIVTNLRNVNYTIYTVTFAVYGDVIGYNIITEPIIWEPENKTPYTVIPTQVAPQLETDYYYCYNYTHWILLVNQALRRAWQRCVNITEDGFGTKCPFFTFDAKSGLFTLCQDANTSITPYSDNVSPPYDVASAETGYANYEYSFVGMNSNLEGLLSNWTTAFYSAEAVLWAGQAGIYLPEFVFNFGLNGIASVDGGGPPPVNNPSVGVLQNNTQFLVNPFTNENLATSFICVPQDFVSTGTLWSPCSSIVITTTKIPVRNEYTTLPVPLGSQNIGTQNKAAAAFQKVLIETPINAVTADIWRGWILYQPLTPTLSSLEDSKVALYELDFYVYWRNRLTGSLIPLRLYNSGTFTIRLLFDRIL